MYILYVEVCRYVCVCVWVSERESERERECIHPTWFCPAVIAVCGCWMMICWVCPPCPCTCRVCPPCSWICPGCSSWICTRDHIHLTKPAHTISSINYYVARSDMAVFIYSYIVLKKTDHLSFSNSPLWSAHLLEPLSASHGNLHDGLALPPHGLHHDRLARGGDELPPAHLHHQRLSLHLGEEGEGQQTRVSEREEELNCYCSECQRQSFHAKHVCHRGTHKTDEALWFAKHASMNLNCQHAAKR